MGHFCGNVLLDVCSLNYKWDKWVLWMMSTLNFIQFFAAVVTEVIDIKTNKEPAKSP